MPPEFPRSTGVPGDNKVAWAWNQPGVRSLVYQGLLAIAVGLGAWYLISNAVENLLARRIASGFGFLSREAGFEIGETTFLSYDAADTYLRAIAVGFLNTFEVAALAILFSTVVGVSIGLARLSRNWLLTQLAAGYVEVIRNVPLAVQLFFWYAVITESLPAPTEALNPMPGVFLSNRGLAFPLLKNFSIYDGLVAMILVGLVPAIAWRRRAKSGTTLSDKRIGLLIIAPAFALGLAAVLYRAAVAPSELDYPVFGGFNFSGGGLLSPEFSALFFGLTLYTAAFIAEIVRAGVLAVDRGQFEAAYSLGHSQRQVMRFVILPQALRIIVPPMSSQYLNCAKNSSLAVAIGYPDLVSIVNTTINQTGQAIEGIAIIMVVYLTISLAISGFMNWYNRRFALKGSSL